MAPPFPKEARADPLCASSLPPPWQLAWGPALGPSADEAASPHLIPLHTTLEWRKLGCFLLRRAVNSLAAVTLSLLTCRPQPRVVQMVHYKAAASAGMGRLGSCLLKSQLMNRPGIKGGLVGKPAANGGGGIWPLVHTERLKRALRSKCLRAQTSEKLHIAQPFTSTEPGRR